MPYAPVSEQGNLHQGVYQGMKLSSLSERPVDTARFRTFSSNSTRHFIEFVTDLEPWAPRSDLASRSLRRRGRDATLPMKAYTALLRWCSKYMLARGLVRDPRQDFGSLRIYRISESTSARVPSVWIRNPVVRVSPRPCSSRLLSKQQITFVVTRTV